MSEIGSTEHSSPTGIMHHQGKLDVFLIRGYQLISNGEVLNLSDLLSSSINANQQSPISMKRLDNRHLEYFQKLSQLYNALVSVVPLDEQSSVPKSNIELFQRFQQILKEILLSYEESPYNRYFLRLDEQSWKIRDDVEDPLWQILTLNIDKVYDRKTGTIGPLRQRKSTTTSARESPVLAPRRKSAITSPGFTLAQVDNKLEQVGRGQDQDYYTNIQTSAHHTPNGQFEWPSAMAISNNVSKIIEKSNSEGQTTRKRSRIYGDVNSREEEVVEELLQVRNTQGTNHSQPTSTATAPPTVAPMNSLEDSHQKKGQQHTTPDVTISAYERLLKEKDQRISILQNDLEQQRKEIIWLKKLLMEDMKYLRSSLSANTNNR